ncbi:hypothetical protein ACFYZH_31970 [Streptomyces abikoensis]|uniref:hypothetical protein n=1 Tax=Streptomyces abikoensis TaxID=97398 RepID=UPI0036A1A0E3
MISLPLFLFAGLGTYVSWRMDSRAALLVCALVCGYALATSPLSGAIDAFGTGIGNAVQNASRNS